LLDALVRAAPDARARGADGPVQRKATLEAFARRGELPPGAFGTRLAVDLAEPLEDLFDEQEEALARWPHAVEDEIELRFEHAVEGQRIEVADWLGGVRRVATCNTTQSAFGSVVLEASALVDKSNHYRGDKLIRHWVRHLALHIALGEPVTTVVISKKGSVELGPRDPAEARQRLREIVEAWRDGMRRPLPLAVVSAIAWLRATPTPESDQDKARKAARIAYEGSFVAGEREQSAYLARAFPSFDALWSDGEFRALAERLLRPLLVAVHTSGGPNA
jgi:exodeoxyribonuclease V gamma subunit